MFQKSDAKIEIIITATNFFRIQYPFSSLNYHLSGANVANFDKIHCTVFEQQLFKKIELKNRSFQYGKVALQVRTQYHQLQFVLKVVTICTDTCMSLVQTRLYFSAADGFPVCRPCSCVNLPQKSIQC